MTRILKALKFKDGDYAWDFIKAKSVLDEYVKNNGVRKNYIYEKLASIISITPDAVKNWFVWKNGPGEAEYVIKMAAFFGVDYVKMLRKLEDEKEKRMEELFEEMVENMYFDEGSMTKTIKIIGLINELASETEKGFMGFNEYISHHKYHGTTLEELSNCEYTGDFEPGILYVDDDSKDHGKIVADMCVDFQHGDIISTYDQLFKLYFREYSVLVRDEDPEDLFIEILGPDDLCVIIEDGRWYCR